MSYYQDSKQQYSQDYPPQQGYQQQQGYPPPPSYPSQGQPQQSPQQYGQQPPQPGQGQQAAPEVSDSGNYQGMSYTVKHRNAFSIIEFRLRQGDAVKSIPGAMVHMSGSVTITGNVKMGFKKLFTGAQMAESTFTGPGTVALTPTMIGDIVSLPIEGTAGRPWHVAKHAYLACTTGVSKDTKAQGLGKALFGGGDLFVYRMMGQGVAWLTSYGAVEALTIAAGEHHIVDNGHLVAWNCEYAIERAGGGTWTSAKTGEGLVCRFTGPGTVYFQTRNLDDFASWVYEHSAQG
ncbi:hypothetical protein LTS10_002791 [Elasticomyces elasticus]|nr:hypothetical protein LTS10_002791 [Elasticomyces elasticus]